MSRFRDSTTTFNNTRTESRTHYKRVWTLCIFSIADPCPRVEVISAGNISSSDMDELLMASFNIQLDKWADRPVYLREYPNQELYLIHNGEHWLFIRDQENKADLIPANAVAYTTSSAETPQNVTSSWTLASGETVELQFICAGKHYSDVTMRVMASQITSVSVVYSTVCPGADQRKHQSSTSLVLVRGIRRLPVNSPHKGPVTRKLLPFDDVIMMDEKFFDGLEQDCCNSSGLAMLLVIWDAIMFILQCWEICYTIYSIISNMANVHFEWNISN